MKIKIFKRKFSYLVVTGTIIVALGTGAFFSYKVLFDRSPDSEGLNGDNGDLNPEVETSYVIQYIYRSCGHHVAQVYLSLPISVSGLFPGGGSDHEYVAPPGWHITRLAGGQMLLTYIDDICPDCEQYYYLGNHNGKIGIFRGVPPNGVLEEDLGLEIKDTFREELDTGVPFTTEEEKNRYLQSFTS